MEDVVANVTIYSVTTHRIASISRAYFVRALGTKYFVIDYGIGPIP